MIHTQAMHRALVCLVLIGCGDDPCDPNKEQCTYEADLSTMTVAAGHEDEDTCQSWTLNNPTELWVSSITQHNDGGYHHANWFFVPDNEFKYPDGLWSCSQAQFSEVVAGLLGGYLFALSTQSHDEAQQLPPGAAIRIPPYSRIIGSSHLLNTSDTDVTTTMHLAIHTIPPTDVTMKLAPARIQYHDLHLDPLSRSSFSTECNIADQYTAIRHAPLQYKLVYTLSHYHTLGVYAQLQLVGGSRDGEVIMRHDGYGDNFGQAIDPPVDLAEAGATGLRFTCGYNNPRSVEVGWGIGDQEMCVIALQAVTDIAFLGEVDTGVKVSSSLEGVQYQGACGMTAFPWDFSKEGGPPR